MENHNDDNVSANVIDTMLLIIGVLVLPDSTVRFFSAVLLLGYAVTYMTKKIYQKEYKECKSELLKQLKGVADRFDEQYNQEDGYVLIKAEKKRLRDFYSEKKKRARKNISYCKKVEETLKPIMFICIVWGFRYQLMALGGQVFLNFFNKSDEEITTAEVYQASLTSLSESSTAKNISETPEKVYVINSDILFLLEEPERVLIPIDEDIAKIFFLSDVADRTHVFDDVSCYMDVILKIKKPDTYEEYVGNIDNLQKTANILAEASGIEAAFIEEMQRLKIYAQEGIYKNWNESLKCLSSSLWDDVIAKRCIVWDGGTQNAKIAFLIANNFQKYALAYQAEGGNSGTILCYYMYSIIWTEQALQFSNTDIDMYYDYLIGRYKDIADDLGIMENYEMYQEQADAIYRTLEYLRPDYVIEN